MDSLDAVALNLLGAPIGYVDIGARGGTHPLIDSIASAVAVLGFEPDRAESERITRDPALSSRYARLAIEPIALSDSCGTATLYETVANTNTSLREPNPVFIGRYDMTKWRTVARSMIETTTLDDVVFTRRAADLHCAEVIKIDIQGMEYETLLGARRVLEERALFLCIEVSFCELYRGQKLFADVERLLRDYGFSFYGFDRLFHRSRKALDKRQYWGRERIVQADAYFLADPYDQRSNRKFNARAHAVLALFALITGYHDLALELLQPLGEKSVPLRTHIMTAATLPVGNEQRALSALAQDVERHPADTNVLIGRFVDDRRTRNDYFDVS